MAKEMSKLNIYIIDKRAKKKQVRNNKQRECQFPQYHFHCFFCLSFTIPTLHDYSYSYSYSCSYSIDILFIIT